MMSILLRPLSFILLVLLLPITATTFKITDSSVGELSTSSSTSAHNNNKNHDDTTAIDHLFEWAKQHGAKISSSIQVQQSSSGGRGLYATQDIPANTELITIPYHLQLGMRQLGMGSDMSRCKNHGQIIAWEYIIKRMNWDSYRQVLH